MPHVEVYPAAIEQEAAVAGRFLIVPIVQVDRAGAHPAEEVILDSHRPGVAVRVHGVAAHAGSRIRFRSLQCDPSRASIRQPRAMDKGQCEAQLWA